MSRNPLAPQHLAASSLGVAGLFFWMKFWHAVFARRVRAQVAGELLLPLAFHRCARICLMQAILQPSGLFVLPLAMLPALPFPWAYAFYQNAAVLDDGQSDAARLTKKAWQQAKLWPAQHHMVLSLGLLFAFCVFLNWITVCLALPQLGKMLFGFESDFTKSPLALLNTTFFATILGLTYLCVDPFLKTIYALRCFYGESLETGEDLKANLKPFVKSAVKTAAMVCLALAVLSATRAAAESTNLPAAVAVTRGIAPPDLDRAINQTIHESKYVWRMPREQVVEQVADQGILAKFLDRAAEMIRAWAKAASHWLEELLRKLFRQAPHSQPPSSGYGWIMALQFLLYGLAAAAIIGLVVFLIHVWRNLRRPPAAAVASEPVLPAPDLMDENVRADQLPEDGWTKLARELLERGEFRLAMRAFYLASLAHLAARNLITIARFKSNRDYERELRRRAHSLPDLLAVFAGQISVFERIWYGTHEATGELAHRFAAGLEKLKAGG